MTTHRIWTITAAVALSLGAVACKPSDARMKRKLDRRIDRAEAKIELLHNRIAGYKQELAAIDSVVEEAPAGDKTVITLVESRTGDFEKYIEIQGAVTSKENVVVSSNSGGVLMSVLVTEGQTVSRGQTLAVVNSDVLQSSIKEVESALELATAVYERQKRLWEEQNIGTELQYLQAKNNKENLEKKLATLQVQLSDATVRSSLNGIVDLVIAKEGEMVGPGSPIARIVNLNQVQVSAEIPERFITSFRKGDKVEVFFPSLDQSRSATIKAVGQVINPGNRTFRVDVDLPNPDGLLKPNLLATLKLKEYESEDVVIVPTKLVQDGSRGKFIMVLEDSLVAKRWIEVGQSYNGDSEVLEGLEGGEQLIDLGFREVLEGEQVVVRETE